MGPIVGPIVGASRYRNNVALPCRRLHLLAAFFFFYSLADLGWRGGGPEVPKVRCQSAEVGLLNLPLEQGALNKNIIVCMVCAPAGLPVQLYASGSLPPPTLGTPSAVNSLLWRSYYLDWLNKANGSYANKLCPAYAPRYFGLIPPTRPTHPW